MSCQLVKLSSIADLKVVKNVLTFIEDIIDEEDEDDASMWSSSWKWGDKFEDNLLTHNSNKKEIDHSWLQECNISLSPTVDLLALSYKEHAVFLTSKWDVIDESDQKKKFYVTYAGTLYQEENKREEITSILCLPLASQKRSFQGGPDWTCVVVGFTSGFIRIYTEKAELLLSQIFHEESVSQLSCQTHLSSHCGNYSEQPEELIIVYPSVVVIVDGFSLFQTLRACRNQLAQATAGGHEMVLPPPLACKKWGFQEFDNIVGCETTGMVTQCAFDHLMTESVRKGFYGAVKTNIIPYNLMITTGSNPYVGFYRATETGSSALVLEVVHAVASRVMNLAGGLRNLKWYQQEQKTAPKIEPATMLPARFGLYDKRRQGVSITVSPTKTLAAVTDTFGRVVLIDLHNGRAVRMWKGYRDAQCGWIQVEENMQHCQETPGFSSKVPKKALFLVIYAPRRGILEVWSLQQGPRVAAFNVGRCGRLLSSNYGMMGVNSSQSQKYHPQIYSCCLMDVEGNVKTISVPFHCSLSERNSKKIRDLHLLKELRISLKSRLNRERIIEDITKILLDMKIASIRQQALNSLLGSRHCTSELLKEVVESLQDHLLNQDVEHLDYESKLLLQTCTRVRQLLSTYQAICELNGKANSLETAEVSPPLSSPHIQKFAENLNTTDQDVGHLLSLVTLHQSVVSSSKKHVRFVDDEITEMPIWEFMSCFAVSDSHLIKTDNSNLLTSEKLATTLITDMSESLSVTLGTFLFHSVVHNGATISDLQTAIEISGILPEKLLMLVLRYWLSEKSSSFKSEIWLSFQNCLKYVCSLADPHSISNENDHLSSWWETIRSLLSQSTDNMAAYIAAIVARSVSITMSADFQVEVHSSQSKETEVKDDTLTEKELNLKSTEEEKDNGVDSDWESVSLDVEQWNQLVKQLEDVLVLSVLLKSQPTSKLSAKETNISITSLLNGGSGIITDLVAAWAVAVGLEPEVLFTFATEETNEFAKNENSSGLFDQGKAFINIDAVKGLLWHVRKRFPYSMEPDALLANCAWEHMVQWNKDRDAVEHLPISLNCLCLVRNVTLRKGIGIMVWKTFIQKRFEALALLMEKVGKAPKERLCRKDLEMSDSYLEQFLDFICNLLKLLLEVNVGSESDNLSLLPSDYLWQDHEVQGPAPLVTLALSQKSCTYHVVYHHLLLSFTMYCIIVFQLKSTRPLVFYDSTVRRTFFEPLHSNPPPSSEVLDESTSRIRTQFLLKVASSIAQSIPSLPEANSSELQSNRGGDGYLQASKWFNQLLELGRGWAINLDEIRRHYVCELYVAGHDSLAEETMNAVMDHIILGSHLLLVTGQRVWNSLTNSSESREKLACLSPELSTWLKTLGDRGQCTSSSTTATSVLIHHITGFLPEGHPDHKRALALLDAL